MKNRCSAYCLAALSAAFVPAFACVAAPPTDNPVAAFYGSNAGYPAWTARIRWENVIDMSSYDRGRTNFERFENARDQLARQGGGVLYYPGGVYDFSEGPFDGPDGRGLMLRSGVVLRGETPPGRPLATTGKLDPPTKFVFGFQRRVNALDVGERLTLELDGADVRIRRSRSQRKNRSDPPPPVQVHYEPAPLMLSFAVADGKIASKVKAFRRGYGRDVWLGEAQVRQSGDEIRLAV
jgi:hypothetical protein